LRADFHWSSERVLRRIRALSPVPGLALELSGVEFFVTRARAFEGFVRALAPGEAQIVAEQLVLRTGDGAICVERATRVTDDGEAAELTGPELAALLTERLGSRSCSLVES
jgi:methionyl-tRNA formyltransferase